MWLALPVAGSFFMQRANKTNKTATFTHFRVTSSLKNYLDTLPKPRARRLAHLQSLVIYLQKHNKDGHGHNRYVNVSSRYFKAVDPHYRKTLQELQTIGEILINDRFSNLYHFCKSYKVDNLKYEPTEVIYFVERKTRATTGSKLPRKVSDGRCEQIVASILDEFEVAQIPDKVSIQTHHALRKLANKNANATRKRPEGRLTHSLLGVSGDCRHLVKHHSGLETVEIDAKACFPHLLLSLCEGSERTAYKALLKGDFYENLRSLLKTKRSRKQIKKSFNAYVSGKCENGICEFFAKRFPRLHKTIIGSNMAVRLQDLEASIFVDGMVQECHTLGLLYLPMHDGALVFAKDINKIMPLLSQICEKVLGYNLPIEVAGGKDNKKSTTTQNAPTPSLQYVASKCTCVGAKSASDTEAIILSYKMSWQVSITVNSPTVPSLMASVAPELAAVRARRDLASDMMAEAVRTRQRATAPAKQRRREGYRRYLLAQAYRDRQILQEVWTAGTFDPADVI